MIRNSITTIALLLVLAILVVACAQPVQVPAVQVKDTIPTVEEPTPMAEEPTAAVEEPAPIAQEPESTVEDAVPATDETTESPDPLVTGLEGASGSAVGPDGAMYVVEGAAGRVARVDPQTGAMTMLIEGLPPAVLPIGGAADIAFVDDTAYVLVTMVGADLPVEVENPAVVGVYRVDGPDSFTVVADIGQWSIDNPSKSDVFIPSGVHYAMDPFDDGFLVTDGHHNRVLYVTLDGEVSEIIAFGNIVPTGMAISGETVYMAEAGPNPHLPKDGKVVAFGPKSSTVTEIASGAPLLVDVEFSSDGALYALAQGDFPEGSDDGSPALPNTGSLVAVNEDGDRQRRCRRSGPPTSLEIIGDTAYIVTMAGEIRAIKDLSELASISRTAAPLSEPVAAAQTPATLAAEAPSTAGDRSVAIDPLAIGDPERGRDLFETGGGVLSTQCIRCHKLDAGGSERYGPLIIGVAERAGTRVPGQSAIDYVRQSIIDPSAYLVGGFDVSMPTTYGMVLSEDDINALVAFILTT